MNRSLQILDRQIFRDRSLQNYPCYAWVNIQIEDRRMNFGFGNIRRKCFLYKINSDLRCIALLVTNITVVATTFPSISMPVIASPILWIHANDNRSLAWNSTRPCQRLYLTDVIVEPESPKSGTHQRVSGLPTPIQCTQYPSELDSLGIQVLQKFSRCIRKVPGTGLFKFAATAITPEHAR